MTRYQQRMDGESWAEPSGKRIKWACCDCGLVHNLVLVAGQGEDAEWVGVAVERNERATAARRAWKRRRAAKAAGNDAARCGGDLVGVG